MGGRQPAHTAMNGRRRAFATGRGSPAAIVAVLAVAGMCSAFMLTLVVPIQAQLPVWLDATREDTAWVMTATVIAAAVSNPIAGRLGDMYGKRRIVLVLLVLLVAGSTIAATSSGIIGVIVGRALQGTAVGIIPLGISILRDTLPRERVDSAIALMSATLGVGGAIGLPISSLVVQYGDWHSPFWMAAGLGSIVFVLVLWLVPVDVLRTAGRFDYVGAAGLTLGLVCVLLMVSRGSVWGWSAPATMALGIGGVLVLIAWGWFELRASEPLLDLRVAARRPVLLTNLASVAFGYALMSSNISYPQLLGLPSSTGVGLGLSLVQTGIVLMPAGIVMLVLSPVSGRLARTVGPRMLLVAGSAALMCSYGFSFVLGSAVWEVVVANIGVGIGIGLGYAAMPMLIMRSVPSNETGASNGVNALSRALGTSTAAAVAGAVLAALSVEADGVQVPTREAFQSVFALGFGASLLALTLALFVPRRPSVVDRHLPLPDEPSA